MTPTKKIKYPFLPSFFNPKRTLPIKWYKHITLIIEWLKTAVFVLLFICLNKDRYKKGGYCKYYTGGKNGYMSGKITV